MKTFPPVTVFVNNLPVELYEGDEISIGKIYGIFINDHETIYGKKGYNITIEADIRKVNSKDSTDIEREIKSIDYVDETERLVWK